MGEIDAKKFIRDEVRELLTKWCLLVFAVLGVGNVIAFQSLLTSVTNDAEKTAKETVESTAKAHADRALERFTAVTQLAHDRVKSLDADYGELFKKVGAAEATINGMISDTSNLRSEAERLKSEVQSLATADLSKVSNLVKELNELPSQEAKTIVDKLGDQTVQWKATAVEVKINRRANDVPFQVDFSPSIPRNPEAFMSGILVSNEKESDAKYFECYIHSLSVNGSIVSGKVTFGLFDNEESSTSGGRVRVVVIAKVK